MPQWYAVLVATMASQKPQLLQPECPQAQLELYLNTTRWLQFEARSQHDAVSRLPSCRCRTLVVGGQFDRICPPEALRKLSGLIPGAELRIFYAGHRLGRARSWVPRAEILDEIADYVLQGAGR